MTLSARTELSLGCNAAKVCWKDGLSPPLCSRRLNVCEFTWHMLSEARTRIIICIDSKQAWAFDQTCTCTQSHKQALFPRVCPSTLGAPRLPPPSLASLMRTGPCAFDPAASPQPRGPSASCLFNNPHSLSSYSPIALGRLWIQSKSTPGRLFDIKASLTETVRERKREKKQLLCGQTAL